MIYFDNAATTKLDDEVLKEMMPYLTNMYGNASAIYELGRESRKAVEDAREKVAKALNCEVGEVYFTSCGSESDNTAIKGIARNYKEKGNHIITSKIEHPAVIETCEQLKNEGFEITYVGVDEKGIIDLDEIKKAIKPSTTLISIMFANNEIGTIEPIKEIGKIAKEHGIIFHTDAVQAVGNVKIDVKDMNIDSLSLSGHKFYGPKGVGVLYVKKGIEFQNFINGGHQERSKRAGTENVAGIVGLGKAIELAYQNLDEHNKKITELRDYFINQTITKISNVKINGDMINRLPGNANISFEGVDAESLLFNLDLKKVCVSSGSACSAGSIEPSRILLAIGLKKEIAKSSLRVTIGKYNTKEEVDCLVENLQEIITRIRKINI